MAKVTIIFKDSKDGNVNTHIEFDPPLKDGENTTSAQNVGGHVVEYIMDKLGGNHDD